MSLKEREVFDCGGFTAAFVWIMLGLVLMTGLVFLYIKS